MLNFRCLVALQILLALLVGVPLYFGLDFSGQTLQSKFPQVKPEEAQAMARLMAGSYGSLALAALGFLFTGPWPYRRKATLGFCLSNLVAAALVARCQHAFSDDWFSYGLLFTHFLLAIGFFLNTLDPDTGDAEPPGAGWLSFPNVLTAAVASLAVASLFIALGGVGSFTRHPGRVGIALGLLFLPLLAVLLALALSPYLARSVFQGEDKIRKRLLKQLAETAAQEERNRLARDLHDSIKQQLFTIHLGVATARERWEHDPPGARARLDDIARSAKEALAEMRALLQQLSPHAVASVGLIEALREQCEALGYRAGAQVDFQIGEALPEDRLPAQSQESLFRIAQEALANVARHARAEHVRVTLGRRGETVVLEIEDDGQGFDLAGVQRGLGLRNMEERTAEIGGQFWLRSEPGKGTTLTVTLPLLQDPAAASRDTLTEVRNVHWFFVGFVFLFSLGVFFVTSGWNELPRPLFAPLYLVWGGLLWVFHRVTRRARRKLADPEEYGEILSTMEHHLRAWIAVVAMLQSLALGLPYADWTSNAVLWGSIASGLAVWAGWELLRFHRSTRFVDWHALTPTQRNVAAAPAVGFAFLMLGTPSELLGLATLPFFGLMLYSSLRQFPTPPS